MVRGTTNAALAKLLKRAEKIQLRDLAAASTSRKNTPNEVTELVATILAGGIRAGASTIHIEPRSDGTHIRHRIDGILNEALLLPLSVLPVLVAGLKILVHMPVSEDEQLPQQAATTVTVAEKPYKLQVATIPVEGGEKAVVQLTLATGKAASLHDLGYWGPNLTALSTAITKPRGLVLVTGSHDAGLNETIFSVLSQLTSPHVSIATIEDPITHHLAGAMQTQVNTRAGLDFATGLKTLLKQDANVLMISNIRDQQTAQLAVEAALSGRLVIAGLYVESAVAALGYLEAAEVEPYLLAHTLQAILGQRQVRRLCDNCKEIYTPTEQEMITILRTLGVKTAAQLQRVRELEHQAIAEKLVVGASPASEATFITKLYRASKSGCTNCTHTGYKGVIGIQEVLPNREDIQHLILGKATLPVIESQAVQNGMPTMQMDGLVKVLIGLTSTEEVMRVTQR